MEKTKQTAAHALPAVLLILLACGLLLLFLTQLITLQSLPDTLTWILSHPAATAVSAAAFWAVGLLIYGAGGKMFLSFLLTALPLLALSAVSYYKTSINGFPLMLSDLKFWRDLGEITDFAFPQMELTVPVAAALLLTAAVTVLLFFADRRLKVAFFPRRAVLLAASAAVTVSFFCCGSLLSSTADMERVYSQSERIDDIGVTLAFYGAYAVSWQDSHAENNSLIEEIRAEVAEEESSSSVQAVDSPAASVSGSPAQPRTSGAVSSESGGKKQEDTVTAAADEETELPSVILIMSESFFDLSRLDGIEYPEDITPVFHRLADECTSGLFYSNTYAGGTGNVELEVMTGISQSVLHEGDTLTTLDDGVYGRLPTMASVFADHGYRNIFLHAHTPQLYNRQTIYEKFGFDEILFDDSFPEDAEYRGGFLSDHAFAQKIISLYEENRDQPLFLSAVSMENHQPYNDDKFADRTDFGITGDRLEKGTLEAVQNYAVGLRDADSSLGELTEYFSQQEEPVMLVFFGDHLPNLSAGSWKTAYYESGYISSADTGKLSGEEMLRILSTDYLVWTNYEESAAPDKNTSATLLGLDIMKRLGFELSGYFRWLDENVAPEMTIRASRLFVDGEGRVSDQVPEEKYEMLERYTAVVQDIVYGENRIFG